MRAHDLQRQADGRLARKSTSAGGSAGPANLLTPKGVLHLQRTAGNEAVAGAITVQRKAKMMEFTSGTIEFHEIDQANKNINVTGGWLA